MEFHAISSDAKRRSYMNGMNLSNGLCSNFAFIPYSFYDIYQQIKVLLSRTFIFIINKQLVGVIDSHSRFNF
jgi:hypothetical protein